MITHFKLSFIITVIYSLITLGESLLVILLSTSFRTPILIRIYREKSGKDVVKMMKYSFLE